MGEYVMTTISIGGTLTQATLTAFVAAAQAYYPDADERIAAALADGTRVTLEAEQNYGNTPDLDAFCRAHGLAYQRAWTSALGVFEAGLEHWRPGLAEPVEEAADEGGDPMMTLAGLRRCLRTRQTLADVVARLSAAHVLAVPPLMRVREDGGSPPA